MSGDEAGGGEERRSLLGEFSTSITPRHEVEMERNFKLTHQDELAADQAFNHHMNNLDQKWLADRHALSASPDAVPTFDYERQASRDVWSEYENLQATYQHDKEAIETEYDLLKESIRDNGEPLVDVFEAEAEQIIEDELDPVMEEYRSKSETIDELGADIDRIYAFNSSADQDYYGDSVGYDYDPDTNPFTEEFNLSYYGEDDFLAPDNGNDNGNDGGGRGM